MKITNLINEKSIVTNIKAQSKRGILEALADEASLQTGLDKRIIFESLLERESLGSTGLGNKTAIPHARIADLQDVFVLLAPLSNAVEFDAIDGAPVDLLFLLLSPENNGADHLTALASVSRVLKDEALCNTIRGTSAPIEAYSLLKNSEF